MNPIKKSASIFLMFVVTSLFSDDGWLSFKNETIAQMSHLPGWCSSEKALLMMDLIRENRCQYCIEIGVFSGMSLLPIAKALSYNGEGKVFGIDAWDAAEATKGFSSSDPNYAWWNQLNFNELYKKTLSLIKENGLRDFCEIIKQPSENGSHLFSSETIDFIHLDGNHNEGIAFQDMLNYFPKVKNGGYILLNDPNWSTMKRSLVFLLERADLLSPFSPTATYFLFRKNNQREKNAEILFQE